MLAKAIAFKDITENVAANISFSLTKNFKWRILHTTLQVYQSWSNSKKYTLLHSINSLSSRLNNFQYTIYFLLYFYLSILYFFRIYINYIWSKSEYGRYLDITCLYWKLYGIWSCPCSCIFYYERLYILRSEWEKERCRGR